MLLCRYVASMNQAFKAIIQWGIKASPKLLNRQVVISLYTLNQTCFHVVLAKEEIKDLLDNKLLHATTR